jgi:hypothetical protein
LSEKHLGAVFFTDLVLNEGFDQNELERIFEVGSVIEVYIKLQKKVKAR